MISTPVAVVRGLLISIVVWGVGAAVTAVAFHVLGASTTISDAGGSNRVQIIWWGSHAFAACVGAVLGVSLAGTALTKASVRQPTPSTLVVGTPIVLVGLGVVAGMVSTGMMGVALAGANLLGLLIGVICGSVYVIASGMPDDLGHSYGTTRQRSQSWGSR